MQKTITHFEISAKGLRRAEHPTGFTSVVLEIRLSSPDVSAEDVQKVIALAEDKYCPVWSMIKGNTSVETRFTISA
jgi:putative redox protein